MKIELVDAIPELESVYRSIVRRAIEKGLIAESDWNSRFKNYRDDVGYSMIHYLKAVMTGSINCFVTHNPLMLDNRAELEKKFKLKIMTAKEAIEGVKHE